MSHMPTHEGLTIEKIKQLWRAVRTDGCTASPDLWWGDCCNDHDRHYVTHMHRDGTPITRYQADLALFRCMKQKNIHLPIWRWVIPSIYFVAVRIFGRKLFNSHK